MVEQRCKWTLGQKVSGKVSLLAGQFAWPELQKLCQCHVKTSGLGHGPSYHDNSFQTPSVSSFDKDEAISRTDEGFYLQCAAVVDNNVC